MKLQDEEILTAILGILSAFSIYNIDPSVGMFYTFAIIFYFVPLLTKRKDWLIEYLTPKLDLIKSIVVSAAVFAGWLITTTLIYTAFMSVPTTESVIPQQVFAELSRTSYIPVLSDNPGVLFVVYGVFIPLAESMFFLSFILKFWSSKIFHLPEVRWYKPGTPQFWKMLWVCALVAACGSLFHMTARITKATLEVLPMPINLYIDYTLTNDFFFFFVSSLVVFFRKRLFESSNFHIFVNIGVLLLGGR